MTISCDKHSFSAVFSKKWCKTLFAILAKIASQNRAAANKGNKSPKHNTSNRQAKGNPKVHKNLSATVSVSSTTRSKSIMYKKRP